MPMHVRAHIRRQQSGMSKTCCRGGVFRRRRENSTEEYLCGALGARTVRPKLLWSLGPGSGQKLQWYLKETLSFQLKEEKSLSLLKRSSECTCTYGKMKMQRNLCFAEEFSTSAYCTVYCETWIFLSHFEFFQYCELLQLKRVKNSNQLVETTVNLINGPLKVRRPRWGRGP